MIDPVQFFDDNWALIVSAPGAFLAAFLIGTAIGTLWSRRRINILNERLEAYKDKLGGASPDQVKKQIEKLAARLHQFQRDVAPRKLGIERIDAITRSAKRAPGRIFITYDLSASDGPALQGQLLRAFRQANWIASGNLMVGDDVPKPHELELRTPSKETAATEAALEAMRESRLPFDRGEMKPNAGDADAEIVIFASVDESSNPTPSR